MRDYLYLIHPLWTSGLSSFTAPSVLTAGDTKFKLFNDVVSKDDVIPHMFRNTKSYSLFDHINF